MPSTSKKNAALLFTSNSVHLLTINNGKLIENIMQPLNSNTEAELIHALKSLRQNHQLQKYCLHTMVGSEQVLIRTLDAPAEIATPNLAAWLKMRIAHALNETEDFVFDYRLCAEKNQRQIQYVLAKKNAVTEIFQRFIQADLNLVSIGVDIFVIQHLIKKILFKQLAETYALIMVVNEKINLSLLSHEKIYFSQNYHQKEFAMKLAQIPLHITNCVLLGDSFLGEFPQHLTVIHLSQKFAEQYEFKMGSQQQILLFAMLCDNLNKQ